MTVTDKKTDKASSKGNLNESNIPLLEDPENLKGQKDQEKIEMETKGGDAVPAAEESPKKQKKEKKIKESRPRVSPAERAVTFTAGLNVIDRDDRKINRHVNLNFEDILAETDSTQGFEFIWRLTFLIFTTVRLWLYRIVAGVIAIPLALIWAVIFSFINVFVVWIFTPSLKIFDLILHHVHRVWSGLIRTFLDPVFTSGGLFFSNFRSYNTVVPHDTHVV
jgi:caveolin 1